MTFDWTTFTLQLVNVLILLAILRRFLFRPVAAIIAARTAQAQAELDDAARARTEAARARDAAAAEAQATVAARDAVLSAAREEAETARKTLLDAARTEAEGIVANGRAERDRDTTAAQALALTRARDLATELARRALAEQPVDALGYVQRLAGGLDAMPAAERGALLTGSGLRVVSAAPLPEDARAAVLAVLDQHRTSITGDPSHREPPGFDTDPALISGVELVSESGRLRNSLAHDLDTLTQAMGDDDTAG